MWARSISAIGRLARQVARIRYRLLLVNLIVAAVPLVGITFARMHEEQLLESLEQDMIHQAQLMRAVVLSRDIPLASHERTLARAARETRTRIRLLDATGAVAADSHRSGPPEGAERPVPYLLGGESPTHEAETPRPIEPLADRREIKTALAGHYGAATRLWDNQERVYLFSALPVLRDDKVSGVIYVTRSTRDIKLQLFELREFLSKVLVGTVIVTALLSLLLATTIARPLGKLTRRAQRIAGRLPAEPDKLAERRDEIGQLARAIEAMTDELQRRAHDARTLAADISHEFKTPLTGIRGAAELLRDGAADDPEVRDRFLAMIIDDTARLDRVVSRLLELARVDDDRTVALPVDLGALARTCARRPWPCAVEVIASDELMISGREHQLAAALENLVANATQFADPETPVTIEIERRSRAPWTRITVANRGPALSAVAQRKVWDRFYS
ncbi:MAG: HAMP domain-containing protein, partial [Deltaproteobacteria bacterium]|nr:HAMP domain-containing protein [Deltaproteobacteria bacterium]